MHIRTRFRDSESWTALRDTIPVAMGYIPLGIAYGVLLTNSGLAWYWAPICSIVVFAGSMQFLSVGLLSTGVPLPQVALATLTVNFRHVFYGLSFPLDLLRGRARRAYGVFALTDETYSLLATKDREELTGRRVHLVQVFSHAHWVLGSTLGALASFALPPGIEGLDFALTALFTVLALEGLYKAEGRRSAALALAATAVAALVGGGAFLTVAIGVFVVLVLANRPFHQGSRK